jgi:sec-independent protein translocase protein TatB
MFDFAWSEIALIGVVALVLIGPKDLPIAIKTVTGMIKKARRMAAEFQTHVDEMVKDADLHEVRDQIREIRSLDIRGTIARAVDKDGTIRQALQDPIRNPPPPAITMPAPETAAETLPNTAPPLPEMDVAARAEPTIKSDAPAFIPPTFSTPAAEPAPAMIPPAPAKPVLAPPVLVPQDAGHSPQP